MAKKKKKTDLEKFKRVLEELNQIFVEYVDEYDCTEIDAHDEESHAVFYFDENGRYLGIHKAWTKL